MPVAAFEPKFMKVGVLTAALQELTPREKRDPDPDLAVEEWAAFAREVGADYQRSDGAHFTVRYDSEQADTAVGKQIVDKATIDLGVIRIAPLLRLGLLRCSGAQLSRLPGLSAAKVRWDPPVPAGR